jgi:ribonucleoside-diphosphate reductase alpha chain
LLVIKRDGSTERFNKQKIVTAVRKALHDVNKEDRITIKEIKLVASDILDELKDLENVKIETIQDKVILHLFRRGHNKLGEAYILFRDKKRVERENPWINNDERQDMILSKYLIDGETKKEFIDRISIGKNSLKKIFRRKEALWGGRNLFAIGRDGNITGSNCYVIKDPEDSLEDIYRFDYEIARTYSYGGGCGGNLSKLRPRDAKVNNSSNTTPGPMIFAEKYSHTTLNTQQSKRRGALMLVMNIDHPDIIDFATTKLDLNKISGANISIGLTDDFMRAVENDEDWEMSFDTKHEKITKKCKAQDLLNVIDYAIHTVGDPGALFLDNVNEYHLTSEYDEVEFTATNPCGGVRLT